MMESLNVKTQISFDTETIVSWRKSVEEFTRRANYGLSPDKGVSQALAATKEELREFSNAWGYDDILDAICDLFVTSCQLLPIDYDLPASLYKLNPVSIGMIYDSVGALKRDTHKVLEYFMMQGRFTELFEEVVRLIVHAEKITIGGVSIYMGKVLENNGQKILSREPSEEETQEVINKYAAKGITGVTLIEGPDKEFYVYRADGGDGKILKPAGFVDLLTRSNQDK